MIFPPTDDSYCIYLVVLLLSENDNLTKLSTICSASIEYKTQVARVIDCEIYC